VKPRRCSNWPPPDVFLLASETILLELREKLTEKLKWGPERIDFFLKAIQNIVEIIEPTCTSFVFCFFLRMLYVDNLQS